MKRIQRPLSAEREKRSKTKRNMLPIIALMAATTFGGAFSAQAFPGSLEECGMQTCKKIDRNKRFDRMAEELKLNNNQREQIKTIIKTETEQTEPLRKKLLENRQKLRQTADAEHFDEAAVKALAETQANLQSELIVSRAQMHNRVNSILTPEQRELAKKFYSSIDNRKGNRKRGK